MTERFTMDTTDGVTLEARWDSPQEPAGAVVFCHPHPLQGGTMMAPLMIAVAMRLVDRGLSVLRFNFRGTGNSGGAHDHGGSEQLDVGVAFARASETGLEVSLAGWSFGAATALRWLSGQETGVAYVGIAPPSEGLPESLPPGPKRIVVGTRDQLIDVDQLRAYAASHSMDLVLTPGDHFFHGRGKKIGDLVYEGLRPS
jgi:alpha/beta superfamily hydrolase